MKKTVLFISCAVLLLSASIVASLSVAAAAGYELVDQQGDRTVLKGIDLSFALGAGSYQINVLASDGEVSHQIVRNNEIKDSEGEQISPVKEDPGEPIGEWEIKQIPTDPPYKVKRRSVGSVALNYYFYKYDKHMSIETGLRDHSNEAYSLYEEIQLWDNVDVEDSRLGSMMAELKDEQTPAYVPGSSTRFLATKDQETYYLMPDTGAYTTGINHLYQINLSKENFGYQELCALPEQRSYQELYMIHDQLIVISSQQDTLYFDKYDLKGNLLGSWETTRSLDVTYYQKKINDQYLILKDREQTALVLDTDTMSIIAEEPIDAYGDRYITDMVYQNGILYYALVKYQQYTVTGISIMASKDGRILYEGTIAILEEDKTTDQTSMDAVINAVNFVRK